MKDLKKAIQRCHPTILIESWFRDFLAQKSQEYCYYRSEDEFKLMTAVKVLQKDGICCRKHNSQDLTHLVNIIKSRPEDQPETHATIQK